MPFTLAPLVDTKPAESHNFCNRAARQKVLHPTLVLLHTFAMFFWFCLYAATPKRRVPAI